MDLPAPLTIGYSELFEAILELDNSVFGLMVKKYGVGNTGGVLHICDADGREMLHRVIGDPDPVMAEARSDIARQNAHRLLSHPDHFLASQSMNAARDEWDGAIRMENGVIISFSTIAIGANEAFCASIGYHLGMSSIEYLMDVLSITRNARLFLEINALVSKALGKTPPLTQAKQPSIT